MFNISAFDVNGNFISRLEAVNSNLSFQLNGINDSSFSLEVIDECKDLRGSIIKVHDCRCEREIYCGIVDKIKRSGNKTIKISGNSAINTILNRFKGEFIGGGDVGIMQSMFDRIDTYYPGVINVTLDLFQNQIMAGKIQGSYFDILTEILQRTGKSIKIDGCNIEYPYTPRNIVVSSKEGCYSENYSGIVNSVNYDDGVNPVFTLQDTESINQFGFSEDTINPNSDSDGFAQSAQGYLSANSVPKVESQFCIYECTEACVGDNISVSGFCSKDEIRDLRIASIKFENKKITIYTNFFESLKDVIKRIS